MLNNNKARVALVAGALVAGLSIAGVAAAQPATPIPHEAIAPTASHGNAEVEHQGGVVLEAMGSAGGPGVSVTVYENSLHGNSVQVVLGEDLIGYAEGTAPYLVDGVLHATVEIDGRPATVSGTITPTGRAEKVVEPIQDAGEQVVTRGTHTPLGGEATLSYGDTVVPLELTTAFRYDLDVRRVALYGN